MLKRLALLLPPVRALRDELTSLRLYKADAQRELSTLREDLATTRAHLSDAVLGKIEQQEADARAESASRYDLAKFARAQRESELQKARADRLYAELLLARLELDGRSELSPSSHQAQVITGATAQPPLTRSVATSIDPHVQPGAGTSSSDRKTKQTGLRARQSEQHLEPGAAHAEATSKTKNSDKVKGGGKYRESTNAKSSTTSKKTKLSKPARS